MNKRKTGLPPGTMVYTGRKEDLDIRVVYVEYDKDEYSHEIFDAQDEILLHQSDDDKIQWYDIRGLHDTELIQRVAEEFSIHTLAMEDIVDVHKRPEYVEYKSGHFISFKSFEYSEGKVQTQTISIFFGRAFVLTFQEFEDDVFADIRARLEHARGRIRDRGADYLAYAIMDMIVDRYYHVIDRIEENLESLELLISSDVDNIDKGDIQANKVNLIRIRKSVIPLREALNQFIRSESDLIDPRTEAYLRDLYDHTIQVVDSADTLRDILGGLNDLYISEISLRMNRIMQVLTIVTGIFVPLSFLTGLYGMNFEYIPELGYRNGYFILWAFMLLCVVLMIGYFKKKKWL